ncbi:MAG: hypothetical protein K1X94_09410 [Sandaracinaceae bacterium]|nr:hypothetical protein [Sandaracinaceae bacterium]
MDDERSWARRALGAGLVVLALSAISTAMRPSPCGALDPHYPPIVAFELARSQGDLDAVFGAAPSACRDAMVLAMDRANTADVAIFIPAYALFVAGFFASFRARRPGLARAGAWLLGLGALFDLVENACLFALTPTLDASSLALALLPWMTGVKWCALALAAVPEALLLRDGGRLSKAGAALALLAPIGTVAAMIRPDLFGRFLALSIVAAWVPCLVSVAVRARRAPA